MVKRLTPEAAKEKGAKFTDTGKGVGEKEKPPIINVHVENKDVALDDKTQLLFAGLIEKLNKTPTTFDTSPILEAVEKLSSAIKTNVHTDEAVLIALTDEIKGLRAAIELMNQPADYTFEVIRDKNRDMKTVKATAEKRTIN